MQRKLPVLARVPHEHYRALALPLHRMLLRASGCAMRVRVGSLDELAGTGEVRAAGR